MGSHVSIGDFSVMTRLSRKALRHYHDLGLLEPDHVDEHTGYRFYDTGQVDRAHIIRRFRALGMPIADIDALLGTDDVGERSAILAAHLQTVEAQLERARETVRELHELLEPARPHLRVATGRHVQTPVWALGATIDIADISAWFEAATGRLVDAVRRSGTTASGPGGGIYERALFTESRGTATIFIPVAVAVAPPEPVRALDLPAADWAMLTHAGVTHADIDRSYGQLGTYVSQHLISAPGPIREHYLGPGLGGFADFDRTEIYWPIFSTS